MKKYALLLALLGFTFSTLGAPLPAKEKRCKGPKDDPAIVWCGASSEISFEKLAAYLAPILVFSPDEPLLEGAFGKNITIPQAMPFEPTPKGPVVYYRVRSILASKGFEKTAVALNDADKSHSTLNLDQINGIELDYFFYYASEAGVGHHPHDIESVEFKLEILKNPGCPCAYAIKVGKIVAKAHGIDWYDNILYLDKAEEVKFPMTILVEEGKHASCTDRNRDLMYSPGYDINRRINDAWGIRDIIRSGSLITGAYQSWMTKQRSSDYLVVPPLPTDSPWYSEFTKDRHQLTKDKAVYQLRPFPSSESAVDDPLLQKKIVEKEGKKKKKQKKVWPEVSDHEDPIKWLRQEPVLKSIGVAYRYDGDHGFAVTVPFLLFRNFEVPLSGGWLVHRFTLDDHLINDFGYSVLYTRSASRWVGGYFASGYDRDRKPDGSVDRNFAAEAGIKFRVNLENTFLRPITKVSTRFWGLRVGIRSLGIPDIEGLDYIVEFGAGVW